MRSNPTDRSGVLFDPITTHSASSYALATSLLAVVLWGAYAYYVQFTTGLGVTGMRAIVSWAFYIINFVFFIGISHVGALMSAILRLTNAEWRKPVTRIAEVVTFASLMMAAMMPLIDLGRPDRILNVFAYARVQSPLVWDFLAIGTYMIGSTIFLYLPMIPDIASCRDKLTETSRLRRWIYNKLSIGWKGSESQRDHLEKAIKMMSIIIIPIAISVHTVVSWDFAMLLRTGWNSTIFGPYFVAGALLSGVATVILVMAVLTKYYHLDSYITKRHFDNLGKLLLALDMIVIYFTINEDIVPGYKFFEASNLEGQLISALFWGKYAPFFWIQVVGGLVIPALIIGFPRTRTLTGYLVASLLIDIGMWVERFNIVVPSLALPQLNYSWGSYTPTWIEVSIVAASFAGFMLIYLIFTRLFPIVSIWETEESETISGTGDSQQFANRTFSVNFESAISFSKRNLLKYGSFAAAGFALGLIPIRVPSEFSTSTNANHFSASTIPLSNLGESVLIANARGMVDFSISMPSELPPRTELKDVRISGDQRVVTLLYDSPAVDPLSIYGERVAVVILQSQDEADHSPPIYLPPGFSRVSVSGEAGFARDPSRNESDNILEPGQVQWWKNGVRCAIFANLTIDQLIAIAESMEVS